MSASIPSTSGNGFSRFTNLDTTDLSVFMRIRRNGTVGAEAWALLVSTSDNSDVSGHGTFPDEAASVVTEGRSIHGIVFTPLPFVQPQ